MSKERHTSLLQVEHWFLSSPFGGVNVGYGVPPSDKNNLKRVCLSPISLHSKLFQTTKIRVYFSFLVVLTKYRVCPLSWLGLVKVGTRFSLVREMIEGPSPSDGEGKVVLLEVQVLTKGPVPHTEPRKSDLPDGPLVPFDEILTPYDSPLSVEVTEKGHLVRIRSVIYGTET